MIRADPDPDPDLDLPVSFLAWFVLGAAAATVYVSLAALAAYCYIIADE